MDVQPVALTPMERARMTPEAGYALNRDNWDGRALVHAASSDYDLDGLVGDPTRLSTVIRDDLQILRPHLPEGLRDGGDGIPRLDGLDVCHLQCHLGTDTLSLARRGGRCTGVDLSPESLRIARDVAARAGQEIRYVEANVLDAAAAVGAEVDHVHTSIGTICWVQDLATWGRQIAALLRPGGTFFFRDSHPMLNVMDDTDPGLMTPGYGYFPLPTGESFTYADGQTYTDGDAAAITQPRNAEWSHSVSEILGALIDAGLRIEHVGEHQHLPWPAHPAMTLENEGFVLPEPWRSQVPVALSIVARREPGPTTG